ncbi:unnamed protein product [Phaedon cochleariae]|uniref:POPDC1-3 domain-containing protein n=1 Tax=Phaedon cochleariae TaxID=80249 RepID=A0A9N9X5P0_PHACE|nr:unnamed protein product [Phaedon cochleariae]
MEAAVILSRIHSSKIVPYKTNFLTTRAKIRHKVSMDTNLTHSISDLGTAKSNYSLAGDTNATFWNRTDILRNLTNVADFEYDYQMTNGTVEDDSAWSSCKEWTPAQHSLFQMANFFFAAAFLVPGSFKQSVLLVRALLSMGYFFLTIWGGVEVCAPDILLWNLTIVVLNAGQTALLTWKFLPPTLTLELTELYLKVFKPLRISKKHFKELVKDAKVMNLEEGDIYAVEEVSPADERLSILLRGKLRVTCDDTHLHFISTYQFVDSPEWEANHEQSDDVFQVTIAAEEDSVYLCWSRMKLERVLRHRPMLKTVFDSIIGKDITQKLYALNEHLSGLSEERERGQRKMWAKTNSRSMSMDAVNTGTTGLVRSQAYRTNHKNPDRASGKPDPQCWVPLVAKQFPAKSPFNPASVATPGVVRLPEVHGAGGSASGSAVVGGTGGAVLQRTRSSRRSNREVKFESNK